MIEHVYRRACRARTVSAVVVATDDARVRAALAPHVDVRMTPSELPSGTDRVAAVARELDCQIVVNVQGDQPLLEPAWIDAIVERLRAEPAAGVVTCAVPVRSREEFEDPAVVKVVTDPRGRALLFSRAPIPHERDNPSSFRRALHHVGIYGFRRETLLRLALLPPSPLEQIERLEQLRALENGIGIGVIVVDGPAPLEVDTPRDLERARAALREAGSGPPHAAPR